VPPRFLYAGYGSAQVDGWLR